MPSPGSPPSLTPLPGSWRRHGDREAAALAADSGPWPPRLASAPQHRLTLGRARLLPA